jgi:hypothetical protein
MKEQIYGIIIPLTMVIVFFVGYDITFPQTSGYQPQVATQIRVAGGLRYSREKVSWRTR